MVTAPASKTPMLSGLGLRIASALVLAPLTIAAVMYGSSIFYAFMALVFAISLQEWSRLSLREGRVAWGILIGGIFYIGLSCFAAIWLRDHAQGGFYMLLYVFFAIWASDSFAYASGKLIGGPKLAPSISPKKTWAGLIGGCAGAGAVLVGYDLWLIESGSAPLLSAVPLWVHGLAGVLLGIIGQVGDLSISVLKRRTGLKDTGNIIPGHGGLLDRIDALLLAVPLFAAAVVCVEVFW